jgi:hypothetical protein
MGFGSRLYFSQKTVVGAHDMRPQRPGVFSPPCSLVRLHGRLAIGEACRGLPVIEPESVKYRQGIMWHQHGLHFRE